MCGIVGVMTEKLTLGDYLRFKDLFTLAQLRGDDGAGIITVPKKQHVQNVRVRKTTWSSGHLVTTGDYDDAIKGDNSMLIGHARQPTRGASKMEFVHPHSSDGICLVHNGTMTTIDGKTIPNNESDSKLICKMIATQGVEEFVDKSYGAYCLVWVDINTQTINFLRNAERPLWMVEQRFSSMSESVTHLWWASELWMVYQALSRYPGYSKETMKAFSLPVNEWWSFPLTISGYALKAPTIKKVEKKYQCVTYPHSDVWDAEFESNTNVGGTGANTSVGPFLGNNSNEPQKSGSGTTNGSPLFKYTPPEYRRAEDAVSYPAVVSVARILERSKQDAELATAQAEEKAKEKPTSATFPKGSVDFAYDESLDKYAETDQKRVMALVSHSSCIWCETKPSFVTGKITKIFPVRFATDRRDYACSECIKDLDIQRMVGIG